MLKKSFFLLFFGLISIISIAQGPYYNGVDFTTSGIALRNELSSHIISTHSNNLSYSQVWNVLKQSDLDPGNSSKVLLLYGYDDTDGSIINDRTRNKNDNGGSVGDWNREHTYPKSLGTPNLGTSGPGSDAHHLRSTDVQMNGSRGSKKFVSGSGNAGPTGSGWYPGDEWKGDVARMMMYMYLRYGDRCYPNNVGIGSTNSVDNKMINLFLEWNAADPVSEYELNRNDVVEDEQGNRNPFIDEPALAYMIWNGPAAADPWGLLVGVDELSKNSISIYPNPSDGLINITTPKNSKFKEIEILNLYGERVYLGLFSNTINTTDIAKGTYFIRVIGDSEVITKKIVVY